MGWRGNSLFFLKERIMNQWYHYRQWLPESRYASVLPPLPPRQQHCSNEVCDRPRHKKFQQNDSSESKDASNVRPQWRNRPRSRRHSQTRICDLCMGTTCQRHALGVWRWVLRNSIMQQNATKQRKTVPLHAVVQHQRQCSLRTVTYGKLGLCGCYSIRS